MKYIEEIATIKAQLMEAYKNLRVVIHFDGSPGARGMNQLDKAITALKKLQESNN